MARFGCSSILAVSVSLFLLFFGCLVSGDNSVYILSKYRQRVTSSTLNWLPISHYEEGKVIVIGGFESQRMMDEDNLPSNPVVTQRSIFVCRAFHNGVPVAGKQIEGEKKCTVTYLGNVASYTERYDLLENVDDSARLSWLTWDQFRQIPVGAVAAETQYVARHVVSKEESDRMEKDHGYTHYIGTYDASDSLGVITYVMDDGKEGTAKSGEILVETEPTFYELDAVKLMHHRKRIIKRVSRVLGEATISNTGSESALFAKDFAYKFNYSIYWGQGHAMIKALNTSIRNVDGTKLGFISWGIEDKSDKTSLYTLRIRLEPGTAVNVTLRGNYTDMEVPYSGELVSLYEDGERRSRVMSGMRRDLTMLDVEPQIGPIYFLSNMSLVPTTVAPPSISTEAAATLTPSAKSTTNHDDDDDDEAETSRRDGTTTTPEMDENLIVAEGKKKNRNNNDMQNDDGEPLSLKNKVQSSGNSRVDSLHNLSILGLTILVLWRIT